MSSLAIIIPCYKSRFLYESINSIVGQTNQNFVLYVVNDASPDDVSSKLTRFNGFNINYIEYQNNMGRTSLTSHWNRCIDLVSEDWVWLFGDDDIAANDCVHLFYEWLKQKKDINIVRFNSNVIDSNGIVIKRNKRHPVLQTSYESIINKIHKKYNSYLPDHIFKKEAFIKTGGFDEYPLGWCADDAAWVKFSMGKMIETLPTVINWRLSGDNISSYNEQSQEAKLKASYIYRNYIVKTYTNDKNLINKIDKWLYKQVSLYTTKTNKLIANIYKLHSTTGNNKYIITLSILVYKLITRIKDNIK